MSRLIFKEEPYSRDEENSDSDDSYSDFSLLPEKEKSEPVTHPASLGTAPLKVDMPPLKSRPAESTETSLKPKPSLSKSSAAVSKPAKLASPAARVKKSSSQSLVTAPVVSNWLSKFLSSQRSSDNVMPPPEFESFSTEFLAQFHESCRDTNPSGAGDDESDQEEEEEDVEKEQEYTLCKGNVVSGNGREHVDDEVTIIGDTIPASKAAPVREAESVVPEIDSSLATFRLFNLPYKISQKEVIAFGKRYEVEITTVELGDGKAQGQATIVARLIKKAGDEEVAAVGTVIADKLRERECGGRPVRIQERGTEGRRKSGGLSSRYFLEGLSIKCNNCCQAGHKAADCPSPPVPTPCHLCAGTDHESGSCPNIMCFRCGLFGHHLRNCNNARMSRPVICCICGSCSHDHRACHHVWSHPKSISSVARKSGRSDTFAPTKLDTVHFPKLDGPAARCMKCNKLGHVLCGSLPVNRERVLYCPNCGESGHHIDLPFSSCSSHCKAPKVEAYTKFNQLMKELDDPLSGGKKGQDRDRMYRSLLPAQGGHTQGPNSYDAILQLFPSLHAPSLSTPDSQRHSNPGSSNSSSNGRSQGGASRVVVSAPSRQVHQANFSSDHRRGGEEPPTLVVPTGRHFERDQSGYRNEPHRDSRRPHGQHQQFHYDDDGEVQFAGVKRGREVYADFPADGRSRSALHGDEKQYRQQPPPPQQHHHYQEQQQYRQLQQPHHQQFYHNQPQHQQQSQRGGGRHDDYNRGSNYESNSNRRTRYF